MFKHTEKHDNYYINIIIC